MVHNVQTSHIASCFSVIDLATVVYENLKTEDVAVWSKGWAAAVIYTMLKRQGILTEEEVNQFPNAPYYGLAETTVKGVHASAGAMGHGLPIAVGMALAKKRAGEKGRVFCIMSDGEMQEGTTWESALVAQHNKLDNLVVIVDYNKWVAMGKTNDVSNLEPFADKWRAFNFDTWEIDGHNFDEIYGATQGPSPELMPGFSKNKPRCIIAHTIKGKGVSFFENPPQLPDMPFSTGHTYHYKQVGDDEYKRAMEELNG